MNEQPKAQWRTDALYYRALVDEDGLITGREVAVFRQGAVSGGGEFFLCEGELGARLFDHAWKYELAAEAVRAAEAWGGEGSPDGNWTDYWCSHNGDRIVPGQILPQERADAFRKLDSKLDSVIKDSAATWKRFNGVLHKGTGVTTNERRYVDVLSTDQLSNERVSVGGGVVGRVTRRVGSFTYVFRFTTDIETFEMIEPGSRIFIDEVECKQDLSAPF